MIWHLRRRTVSAILFAVLVFNAIYAAAKESQASDPIPGWKHWTKQLEELEYEIIDALPGRLRDDPQVRQEAGRLLLEAVASQTISALGQDANHPVFLPSINFYLNVGQPNADTTYRSATVEPGGTYRIRGEVGSLRILRLGLFEPMPIGPVLNLPVPTYYDFKKLKIDPSGRFDVLLSPERPADYDGDWWQLKPNTTQLLLRQVAFDWASERDPRISIERLDLPVQRPRPSAEELKKRLDTLGDQIARIDSCSPTTLNNFETMATSTS